MGSLKAPIRVDNPNFEQELNDALKELFEEASSGWAITNKTEDRTLDCNCNDALVVGDVLGTLIDDLIKGTVQHETSIQ